MAVKSGIFAGLATGVQVGAAIFGSQFVVGDVGIGLLGVLRYGIALLFLLPLLVLRPTPRIARKDWAPAMLLGLGQIGVMISLLNTAVLFTSAARVALIFATLPAASLLIDLLRGRDRTGWYATLGVGLTIAGVATLVGYDAVTGTVSQSDIIGMGAALAATLVVAVCSSWYQPLVKRYGAVKISVIAFTVSMPLLGLLAVLFPSQAAFIDWSPSIRWLVLAIGLSSGVGYLLWFHAIENLPPTMVTGFLALSPITATVLSLFGAHTELAPSVGWALLLVCAGIACFALGNRNPKARAASVNPVAES